MAPHRALDPYSLLRSLYAYTARFELPPPAALIGSWHGYSAVIVPSATLEPLEVRPGWLGFIPFGGASIGTVCSGALVLNKQKSWHWVGRGEPSWLNEVLDNASDSPLERFDLQWNYPDKHHYVDMIAQCHAAIRSGQVYQVNLCSAFTSTFSGNPVELFATIGSQLQAKKSSFFSYNGSSLLSFSPETFLTTLGETISLQPIKGTAPRDTNPEVLRSSPKDRAENLMIVDVVRNDLSRICHYGSVHVAGLCTVEPAPGVWHLVSYITGKLRDQLSPQQILEATYPIASITGAPKINAVKYIQQWESRPRNLYCGTAGWITPEGNMDLSVLIRSLEIESGLVTLGAGGGITIDSEAEAEYQEMVTKAVPIMKASNQKTVNLPQ